MRFTLGEHHRDAIVEIGPRGAVKCLIKPGPGDMYTTWQRVSGDKLISGKGTVIVWGAYQTHEFQHHFEGEPVAEIPVKV